MEVYLLKSSLSLIILYALYRVILRYESDHQLNRLLGLACVIFSTGLLFIPVGEPLELHEYSQNVNMIVQQSSDLQTRLSEVTNRKPIRIYSIVYILGVIVFSIRSLIGLGSLLYFYCNSKTYRYWGFKVFALEKDISPFTFFNLLFIGKQRLKDENLDVVIMHEQVHRDQIHSIDTLILEVLTIVFWFNPFIWLFQKEIRATHEFLADEQVIRKGINKLEYQQMLFNSRTGVSLQLGNYLSNKTSLTKRYKMMENKKSNTRMTYMRVLPVLFVMVLMMTISSFTEIQTYVQPDVPAAYKEGMPAMYRTIGDEVKYPSNARSENHAGLVYVSFTVNENGDVQDVIAEKKQGALLDEIVIVGYSKSTEQPKKVNEAMKSEAIRAVNLLGKFTPAQKDGKAISSVVVIPFNFKLANK